MEGVNIVESELAEFEQLFVAFRRIMRRIMERRIQEMMDEKLAQMIRPIMKDCVREVVKEEIQSCESTEKRKLPGCKRINTNAGIVSNERSLQLKFLDEVSDVLTGKEIKGKGGDPIRVALVDEVTRVIDSGPESSTTVEILCLDAHENDNEHNWTPEDFNSRIITESDKMRPQFAKRYHVFLEKGRGVLINAKLAQYSNWTKACKCRLGARIVENLNGVKVKEAWTNPFVVSDSRAKLYAKRFPPSLSDDVWRLVNIGRDGTPNKRLKNQGILTVQDFLYFCSIDSQKLRRIVGVADKAWKTIENHARTCIIDDTRICLYTDSSEGNMSVVFDVVGSLKGVILNSQYVLERSLTDYEKEKARMLLCSAFENREHVVYFGNELTLVKQFPYRASNAGMNAFNQKSFHGVDLDMSENEDLVAATETILSFGLSVGSSVSVSNKTVMHQIPP